jgi:FtsP/CotA-like multicopper oxidase with cupredoxin domain
MQVSARGCGLRSGRGNVARFFVTSVGVGWVGAMVLGCGGKPGDFDASESQLGAGVQRTYFIAADEVTWDYAPLGFNRITGEPFDETANVYVQNGPDRIGSKYVKALYREYTDGNFNHLKPRPPQWSHLGFLGPVIRATVGDSILVHFKNNTTRPVSIHPHGVFYDKNAEGAPYSDGTNGANKDDDAVPPGMKFDYRWAVPERAGPGPADGSSVFWMYHSHTNEVADNYAGLMGPLIVTGAGKGDANAVPTDVDRELVTEFFVSDENQSPYLEQNIATFPTDPGSVNPDDEDFNESNKMHSINGYVFGNLPGLTMNKGQRVRWYLMGMGTEVDLHTPHWHGNTVLIDGHRQDVTELLPATLEAADMKPDDPGTWLYHCHVNDHITAGMLSLYTVNR